MTDYGTKFAETEILLAAALGDATEVVKRVNELLPNERRDLAQACEMVALICRED